VCNSTPLKGACSIDRSNEIHDMYVMRVSMVCVEYACAMLYMDYVEAL
jgi:hypothetical protein